MSMNRTQHTPDILSAIDFRAPQLDWGGGLTRYIRQRRKELGLTQERAAQLAGMELSQWCALESGWAPAMPEDMHMLQAIAGHWRPVGQTYRSGPDGRLGRSEAVGSHTHRCIDSLLTGAAGPG